ncbi:Cathepsin B-like cysteine proteinase, partial [Schistosoma japonicum]
AQNSHGREKEDAEMNGMRRPTVDHHDLNNFSVHSKLTAFSIIIVWLSGCRKAMTDRIVSNQVVNNQQNWAFDLISCCVRCGEWLSRWISWCSKENHTVVNRIHIPNNVSIIRKESMSCVWYENLQTAYVKQKCQKDTKHLDEQDKPFMVSSNEKSFQKEIMMNGPVEAAFDVYEDFLNLVDTCHTTHIDGVLRRGRPYWLMPIHGMKNGREKGLFSIVRGAVSAVGAISRFVSSRVCCENCDSSCDFLLEVQKKERYLVVNPIHSQIHYCVLREVSPYNGKELLRQAQCKADISERYKTSISHHIMEIMMYRPVKVYLIYEDYLNNK